ncbi:hypothetical protein QYF36_022459 [Acer negundo]|nr:hypothetical protein QYF36_022459 [Acer negundo]
MAATDQLKQPDAAMNGSISSGDKEAQISNSGSKRGGWITFPFHAANLIVYLIEEFNIMSIDATQIVNVLSCCTNLFPVMIRAIIADSFFGSFSVISVSSVISLLERNSFTSFEPLTASLNSLRPPQCEIGSSLCKSPSKLQFAVLYGGLALGCIGFGGGRFTLATMGANQYDKQKDQGNFLQLILLRLLRFCCDKLHCHCLYPRQTDRRVEPARILDGGNLDSLSEYGEGGSSDSLASKVELVQATIAAEKGFGSLVEKEAGEIVESEVISSDNTVYKEGMVKAIIEVEKNLASVVSAADSEEELVRTILAVEDLVGVAGDSRKSASADSGKPVGSKKLDGSSNDLRQSNRRKPKAPNSHGMRTRNSSSRISGQCLVNSGTVEEEVDKVVAIGTAIGFKFSDAEEEVRVAIARREEEDNARYNAIDGKWMRFLNRAALKTDGDIRPDGSIAKPWRVCTVQQLEDLTTLKRIFPLWSSSIFLSTTIGIVMSLTILQTLTMDRHLGPSFRFPAGSILVIILISASLFITLIDRLLIPTWQKLTGGSLTTLLQQIGFGRVELSRYGHVSPGWVKEAQNNTCQPPPGPTWFNGANAGRVAVPTTSFGWDWRSISFSGTSCSVLSGISGLST